MSKGGIETLLIDLSWNVIRQRQPPATFILKCFLQPLHIALQLRGIFRLNLWKRQHLKSDTDHTLALESFFRYDAAFFPQKSSPSHFGVDTGHESA
jgi:hypothetical protein